MISLKFAESYTKSLIFSSHFKIYESGCIVDVEKIIEWWILVTTEKKVEMLFVNRNLSMSKISIKLSYFDVNDSPQMRQK